MSDATMQWPGPQRSMETEAYYRPFPEAHGHAIACVFITVARSLSAPRGSLVMEDDECAAAMAENHDPATDGTGGSRGTRFRGRADPTARGSLRREGRLAGQKRATVPRSGGFPG